MVYLTFQSVKALYKDNFIISPRKNILKKQLSMDIAVIGINKYIQIYLVNYSTAHTPKTDVIPTLQRIRSMLPYKLTKPLDRIQAQTLAGIY